MPQNVTMTDSRLTEMSGESEDKGQGSGWGQNLASRCSPRKKLSFMLASHHPKHITHTTQYRLHGYATSVFPSTHFKDEETARLGDFV